MLQISAMELILIMQVLLSLGLTVSALQITIAINGKTNREAQARGAILVMAASLVSMALFGYPPIASALLTLYDLSNSRSE